LRRKENGIIHLEIPKKHYKELEKAYEVCMHVFCSCTNIDGFLQEGKAGADREEVAKD
jgi:hypothetical protein